MIAIVLGAIIASQPSPTPAPSQTPAHAAVNSSGLPSTSRAFQMVYPAYGTPQPQVVQTRSQPGVASKLTLDQATAIAIARVPSLREARAEVDLENAALALSRTGLAPSVSVSGTTSELYGQSGSASGALGANYTASNTLSASLEQLIYDGGQIRARIDAASFTRDAALATFDRSAQTVAENVARYFYQVLEDERTVAVDEQLVEQDVVSENLVRAQIRVGTEAGADLAAQTATTANARTTLVSAQGTFENDRVSFATSLGLDADIDVTPVDDSEGLETVTPPISLPSFRDALAIAYGERPDYRETQLTVASSRASLRASQRGLAPTLSLSGAKGLASTSVGGGSYLNNASLALNLSIPIYDRGVTRANVQSSRAGVDISAADEATTRLQVQQDVRQALIAVVSDEATLDQTRAAYASAVISLKSTQGQFRVGVSTLPALIVAEATLASSATNIVNAIYSLRVAQSDLRYALGTILQ